MLCWVVVVLCVLSVAVTAWLCDVSICFLHRPGLLTLCECSVLAAALLHRRLLFASLYIVFPNRHTKQVHVCTHIFVYIDSSVSALAAHRHVFTQSCTHTDLPLSQFGLSVCVYPSKGNSFVYCVCTQSPCTHL